MVNNISPIDKLDNIIQDCHTRYSDKFNNLFLTIDNIKNDSKLLLTTDLYDLQYQVINPIGLTHTELDTIRNIITQQLNNIKDFHPFKMSISGSNTILLYNKDRTLLYINLGNKTYHVIYELKDIFRHKQDILDYREAIADTKHDIQNFESLNWFNKCRKRNYYQKCQYDLEILTQRYNEILDDYKSEYKKLKIRQKEYIKDLNRVCRFLNSLGYKKDR